eukprot:767263-Hanusia_phi.AAC.12
MSVHFLYTCSGGIEVLLSSAIAQISAVIERFIENHTQHTQQAEQSLRHQQLTSHTRKNQLALAPSVDLNAPAASQRAADEPRDGPQLRAQLVKEGLPRRHVLHARRGTRELGRPSSLPLPLPPGQSQGGGQAQQPAGPPETSSPLPPRHCWQARDMPASSRHVRPPTSSTPWPPPAMSLRGRTCGGGGGREDDPDRS